MQKNTTKARRIINVICGLLVICFVCTGAVYDATGIDITITEVDEFNGIDNSYNVRTRQGKAGEVIEENNIQVGLYDKLNVEHEDALDNGDEIIIKRGVQISVNVDGAIITSASTSATVEEALLENGYFLGETDYTIPSADSTVTDGMEISVIRVTSENVSRDEEIPFEVIYKNDSSLYEGETKVVSEGKKGLVRITENVVCENGEKISATEISREIITEKTDRVIVRGTKKKAAAAVSKPVNTGNSTAKKTTGAVQVSTRGFSYSKKLSMTATAYSAFNKNGGYGKTASGMTAGFGVAAVDPRVIPLGTKLYIEGYGYAIAADTGGAIKGNKIDLCFEKSNSELMAFGRKTMTVYILE